MSCEILTDTEKRETNRSKKGWGKGHLWKQQYIGKGKKTPRKKASAGGRKGGETSKKQGNQPTCPNNKGLGKRICWKDEKGGGYSVLVNQHEGVRGKKSHEKPFENRRKATKTKNEYYAT